MNEFTSRKRSAARAAALMAAAAWAAMQTTPALAVDYYLAGDFNGWNAAGQIMALNPDGSVSATVSGLAAGSRYEFKVTDGTFAATWPPANSWLHADGAGNATITFRPNLTSDSWASDPNRIGVSNDAGTWTAVGDWQSTAWTNNDPATAMSSLGGGLYRYQATIATPGSHEYKAVNTGSWDAIGADGRSINASNWSFTTTSANQLKNLWLNSAAGTIKVADVNTWTGASDSAWNNPANWSRGVTPGTFDDVVFASSGGNVTIAGGSPNINSLRFDENATISGNAILIYGGALFVAAGKSATINTYVHPRRDLVRSGAGTLTVANLDIGSLARGSFTHVQGTTNVSGDLRVVLGSGAGTLQISGGTLDINGNAFFGESGSGAATVQMSGGTLEVAGAAGGAWVGYQGNATFLQSGGNVTIGSENGEASFIMGQAPSAVGTYNLSATGSLTVNGDGYVGSSGSGAFQQSGGSLVVTGFFDLAENAGSTGSYQLIGGSYSIGTDSWVGGEGNGTFTQTGGVATAGTNFSIAGYSTSNSSVNLSGSANFTVNGDAWVGGSDWTGPQGVGKLNISGGEMTVAGALTVFDTGPSDATGTRVNLSGGTLSVGSLNANGNRLGFTGGTLNVNGPAASAVAGNLVISGAGNPALNLTGGALTAGSIRLGSSAGGVGTMTLSAGANLTLKTSAIEIASGSKLDANDNKLIVDGGDVGTFAGGAYSGLTGLIASAYNFSAWDGPGITTSMPDAQQDRGITTLAIATADEVFYAGGTFGGVPVASGDVLVMYTYAGDLNMDGLIDGADYGVIDNFVQFPGTSGYSNGDINYDGVIDGADYGVIDNAIQLQGAPFPSGTYPGAASLSAQALTAVPEPSACGLILLAAAAASMTSRRRRGGVLPAAARLQA